jgi:hypothetical protein
MNCPNCNLKPLAETAIGSTMYDSEKDEFQCPMCGCIWVVMLGKVYVLQQGEKSMKFRENEI